MNIIQETNEKLSERHKMLKSLGKLSEVLESKEFNRDTYYRALRGDETVTATTLEAILKAQLAVINKTKKQLQRA